MSNKRLATVLVSVLAGGFVSQAFAQLEEIVVTAQKREENLQEVPLSVSAFTADDIDRYTAVQVGDLARLTPGLISGGGGNGTSGNDASFFIRGIGQADFTAVQDPRVAVYVDGVYLGRISGANFQMLDVERVEVLRGPQGTLFGRNAAGGAINVITQMPSDELGGKLRLRLGERKRGDFEAMLDLPLIPGTLHSSISMLVHSQEGFGDRVIDAKTMGDIDTQAGRVKLHWLPNDSFDALLAVDVTNAGGTSDPMVLIDANENGGQFFSTPFGVALPNTFAMNATGQPAANSISADKLSSRGGDVHLSYQSIEPEQETDSWGVGLTLNWNVGGITLKSITGYRELDQFVPNDYDASRYVVYDQFDTTEQEQFSQEFQLLGTAFNDRLDYILGAYYFEEQIEQLNAISFGSFPQRVSRGTVVVNNQAFEQDVDTWSIFAQGTFDITDTLAFTAGLRYNYEEKAIDYNFFTDNTNGGPFGTAVFVTGGVFPPGVAVPWPSINGDVVPLVPIPGPMGFPFLPGSSCAGALIPPFPAPPFACRPAGVFPNPLPSGKEDWDPLTWRVALDWQATDEFLGFFSYSRGFASGGFNSRPTVPLDVVPFDEETVDTFELGMKSQWIEDRLQANLTGFFSMYEDRQLLVQAVNPGGFFIIQNAGDVDIWGLEAEIAYVPTDNIRLNLVGSWNENEWQSLTPQGEAAGVTKDSQLPQFPELSFGIGAEYTLPITSGTDVVFLADYYWQDEVVFGSGESTYAREDSYGLLNGRISLITNEDRLNVSLYGLNLTDEEYFKNIQDAFSSFGTVFGWAGRPREWGLEATISF